MGKFFPQGTAEDRKKEFNEYYNAYKVELPFSSKSRVLLDVIKCYFLYGSWTNNYFEYRFWEKSHSKRKEFFTWKKARNLINQVNGKTHSPYFRKKNMFLEAFNDYIKREWLYVPNASAEDVQQFLEKHPYVMEKDNEGMFGNGVKKLTASRIKSVEEYYAYAKENKVLLEECIVACDEIQGLHPSSLNTIRIMTFVNEDHSDVKVLGAVLRMGDRGAQVDNARANGLFAAIDIETGMVITKAMDFLNHTYCKHPYTNMPVTGLQIPCWKEAIGLTKKAALVHPEVRLIGWDVVIRHDESGYFVELIEGNDRPGVPTMQVPYQKGLLI